MKTKRTLKNFTREGHKKIQENLQGQKYEDSSAIVTAVIAVDNNEREKYRAKQ